MSMFGTPGPVYIEFPADVIYGTIDEREITFLPPVEIYSTSISKNMILS